jgi:hypothetical protein
MTYERLKDVSLRPREKKIPDAGVVCVGDFLTASWRK